MKYFWAGISAVVVFTVSILCGLIESNIPYEDVSE